MIAKFQPGDKVELAIPFRVYDRSIASGEVCTVAALPRSGSGCFLETPGVAAFFAYHNTLCAMRPEERSSGK